MTTYPRHAEQSIKAALRDTRVVAIVGPRQSGKTTLARKFARNGRAYLTLDDYATLSAANSDPVAFVRGLDRAVVDEVQRAPQLLLAIKRAVDEDRRPGRFLLTGSANLSTVTSVRESLAGRVETIALYPLAESELLRRAKGRFIDDTFSGRLPAVRPKVRSTELTTLVCRGGYPEAVARKTERRRGDWYRAYLDAIVQRDIPEVASLTKLSRVPSLLQIAGHYAGRLVNLSDIGRTVGLNHKTTETYLSVLEQLFLLRRVQPWSRNELSRVVKTAKLHFVDTGLLTSMRGYSLARLRADSALFGPLLETYVFSELLKASTWSREHVSIYYYRDRDQYEVDFVLENSGGDIVGIEVKSAATVGAHDFRGLQRLASIAGDSFRLGIVLYDGEQTLSFGDRLRAAPVSALWS